MAKDSGDGSGFGNKILSIIITLLIVIIILGVLVACIKLDVGGIGNKALRPIIQDVPVLNKILPKATDEQLIRENNYSYDNIADAIEKIKELELENDKLNEEIDDINNEVSGYISEIERLKTFESQQKQYDSNVKKFNEDIVFNDKAPELEQYKAYYEQIEPENAQEIYRQVIEQLQADETVTSLANTYAKMDPQAAATALEANEDLNIVCEILTNMSEKARAAIMDVMKAEYAAKITNKINSTTGAKN